MGGAATPRHFNPYAWFCYDGDEPTIGNANAKRSFAELVELLRLTKDKYLGDDAKKVRFNPGNSLGKIAGYQHVVVEVEETEGRKSAPSARTFLPQRCRAKILTKISRTTAEGALAG
jgi:hypothetical protein